MEVGLLVLSGDDRVKEVEVVWAGWQKRMLTSADPLGQ